MNALIPNDGTRANDTNLTFTSRSELANQLLLLAQGQELLPSDLEAPIISLVLDLPFVDDVDRQIFCHDLRLLISLESFPVGGLVDFLPLCFKLQQRHSPVAGLRKSLLTLANQSQQGLAFFPLIQEFQLYSSSLPASISSWKIVFQLLVYRRMPKQVAKLTLGRGLDAIPDVVKAKMHSLLYSQLRVYTCMLTFKKPLVREDWISFSYILDQVRFPHTYAFGIALIIREFILEYLPMVRMRLAEVPQEISIKPAEEQAQQRVFQLFCFWLLHSQPDTFELLAPSLPSYASDLELSLDYRVFRKLPFDKVVRYLPTHFIWNDQAVLFQEHTLAIHLAEGKNLRTFSGFIHPVSKKMAHEFCQLQLDDVVQYYSIRQLLTTAYLNTFVPQRYRVLYPYIEHYIFLHWLSKFTDDVAQQQYVFERWDSFLRKLFSVALPEAMYAPAIRQLFGYYRHLIDERIEWSLRGASWNSMLRRANEWYEAQRIERTSPKLASKWNAKSYPGFDWEDTAGVQYTITELTTAKTLRQEGFDMQHCVATYQSRCINGQSAIWSLSKWENQQQERLLTIEVNRGRQIVQMRGVNNRGANKFERNIVQRWASIAKLEIIKGV